MDENQIFDRRAVRLHRDRAAASVDSVEDILREAADRLIDRLDDINRRFTQALDIGGRGVVARLLRGRGIATISCDLSEAMLRRSAGIGLVADEEWLPFGAGSFDLVVANLSLHWVNDLPGTLLQIRHALKPDGLLLASIPVLPSLCELRAALLRAELDCAGGASPRVSPFPDLSDCAGLLQRAGFALPVADAETIDLRYRAPLALLRDLRAAGESNAVALRNRRPAPPAMFAAALAQLSEQPTTVRLAMLTGWAPSPDQPKPLPRGSATHSLADALEEP